MELLYISILGLFMGIVTSISGGAGVFAVPTLIAFGVSPIDTLALNRTSDLGVLSGALGNYVKIPEFNFPLALKAAIPLSIGAFIGANFSVNLSTESLKWFVVFAVLVGIFFLLFPSKPTQGNSEPNYYFGIPALTVVGFWSGSVGMAGATFGVLVLVLLFHRTFLGARSVQVAAAVPETVMSVIILSLNSTLHFKLSFAMYFSSMIGAFLGSKFAIKKGDNTIRYGMVGISLVMIVKVVYDIVVSN